MTDEVFQLTPHDVRGHEFAKVMRGYDIAQVNAFRDRLAEEIERLWRERAAYEARVRGLEEQLVAFKERERAMNEALLAAQELRVAAQDQARREAEVLLREAQAEAERIQHLARQEERALQERNLAAGRQFAAYVTGFRRLLERQLAELEMIEAAAEQPRRQAPQAPPAADAE